MILVVLKNIYPFVEPQFVALVGVSIVVPDACSANDILVTLSGSQVMAEDCYFKCFVRCHLPVLINSIKKTLHGIMGKTRVFLCRKHGNFQFIYASTTCSKFACSVRT